MQKLISVCIIGKPNAGKSTLLNKVIGQKLSIVTPKVQTTRSIITGIVSYGDTQIILYDTPGIFEPKRKLEKAMVKCAWSSLNNADIVVFIIDSTTVLDDELKKIIKRVAVAEKELLVLMNKIDIKSKNYIENVQFVESYCQNSKIINISALSGKGLEDFINYLKQRAQTSPWVYEEDDITNLPARFLACEATREQLFLMLKQELPYNLTVTCENWKEQQDGSVKINQVIIVGRDSHKNIIIGKNGAMIKQLGSASRESIGRLLGKKVHLFLFVKVRANWEDNPELYENMGI